MNVVLTVFTMYVIISLLDVLPSTIQYVKESNAKKFRAKLVKASENARRNK